MNSLASQLLAERGVLLGLGMGMRGEYSGFVLGCLLAAALVSWWVCGVARKRQVPVDRLALVGMWIAMVVVLILGALLVAKAERDERKGGRARIEAFASTYAEELQEMGHFRITTETSPDDPGYLAMIEKQKRWLELTELVADIYTFRRAPDGNGNQLIVDSETDYNRDGVIDEEADQGRESRTDIGEIWLEESEVLAQAYRGVAGFDEVPYEDRWGVWVSAYAPMVDPEGGFDAVVGVDFPAERWITSLERARRTVIAFLGVLVTLILSGGAIIATLRSSLLERRRTAQALGEAKEKADEANQALETSNRDLEQFAYVASHDLQEPLRMVTSFLQLIQKRYGGELGNDADEYIRHAVEGADRMRRLINGLLELSRLNQKEREFQPVDVGNVVEVALDNLSIAVWESQAKIKREQLPVVLGDETQLTQLFQNLIENAIKFSKEGPPVIEIESRLVMEDAAEWWVFSVSDEGPGIAPEHHERVYEIFQRLQVPSEGGGTGIGLALCRRIVENHGGEITLESEEGKGCVFKFNLRAAEGDETTAPEKSES